MHRNRGIGAIPAIAAGGYVLAAAAGATALPPPVAPDLEGAPEPLEGEFDEGLAQDRRDARPFGTAGKSRVNPTSQRGRWIVEGTVAHAAPGELVVKDDVGELRTLVVPEEALGPGVEADALLEGASVRAAYEQRGDRNVATHVERVP